VICQGCSEVIEVDDEYVPGIHGAVMAARLYSQFKQKSGMRLDTTPIHRNRPWEKTLTCGNPDCGAAHEYKSEDLLLYDD
jgi:hypothetical protein